MTLLHRAHVTRWLPLCLFCCMSWPRDTGAHEASARDASAREHTAFYYGPRVPTDLIAVYDQIVVEPSHLQNLEDFARPHQRERSARRAAPVAYLSVGEVAQASDEAKHIPKRWVLAKNPAWSSLVMDLASAEYQAHLFAKFERLWAAGYHRFFLDTLDSYRLAPSDDGAKRAEEALVQIIVELKRRHPGARLLVNRGFEILGRVARHVNGVVAESLFDRWDAAAQRYTRVPESDRRWLLERLVQARDVYGLPVIVIDYRPPRQRREARETAKKIQALGFEPWVTDAALSSAGVGSLEILPRRVMILGNEPPSAAPDGLRLLAPVLEYLGYVPEYRKAPRDWSSVGLEQGYQGVVTWFSSSELSPGYPEWMSAQIARGVRFAIFGVPGFDAGSAEARELGLRLVSPASTSATRVSRRDALIGFEAAPPPRPFDGPVIDLERAAGTRVHLRLVDAAGRSGVAVATTPWGGLAVSHALALRGLHGERAWVIDPFSFLESALALPAAPMPNVTTENGRRLAMLLVRSEGASWPAAFGQPASASVLGDWLSAKYPWPHAVDVGAAEGPESAADRAASEQLSSLPFFRRAALRAGTTRPRGATASVTQVSGMFEGADALGPIAPDSLYLPSGEPQAHPYAQVLETLELTDAPRRLKPVLVDYHAFMAASSGGRATLATLYEWLAARSLFPLHVDEYLERARGFREQIVARDLDGGWRYFGGEALLTVRAPLGAGVPCLERSSVASMRRHADGYYVSLAPGGERRLAIGDCGSSRPHLVQTNGRVLRWLVEPAGGLRLELAGHTPLAIELAGLPARARCELASSTLHASGTTDAHGALTLALAARTTGDARLSCTAMKETR